MALFSKKTKEVKKEKVTKKPVAQVPAVKSDTPFVKKDTLSGVLIRPRVTEKASYMSEKASTYVFEISQSASKTDVAKAVRAMYNVSPIKVRTVKNPSKAVFVRGKEGRSAGVKKAYVTLQKGEKIEFV